MQETQKDRNLKPFLNIVAKLSGAALSFLMLILLARVMTPAAFADFSVLLAWIAIGTTIGSFSLPLVLVRHIAEYLSNGNIAATKGIVLYAIALSSAITTGVIIVAYMLLGLGVLPISPDLENVSVWIACLLLLSVYLTCLSGYLQGLKLVIQAELLINLMRPLLLIVVVFVGLHLSLTNVSTAEATILYTAVCLIILFIALYYAICKRPASIISVKSVFNQALWLKTASGFFLISMVSVVHEKLDLILISALSTADATAIYAVAAKFSQTILMAMIAITAVMAPQVAELIPQLREGETQKINTLVQTTTRTMVVISLLALLGFALLGKLFLLLFGDYYVNAYIPLLLLSAAHVVCSLFGPSVALTTFLGETKIALISICIGVITNITLSLYLTPKHAEIGAASSMAIGMIVTSVLAAIMAKRKLNLFTPLRIKM